MQRLFVLVVLAGCPAPARYVVADVTAARAPVPNALVAAACGAHRHAAQRTDEEGRARLRVAEGGDCSLLVAKPGFPTVETGPVSVCPSGACAPTRIDLTSRPAPIAREDAPLGPRPLEVAR